MNKRQAQRMLDAATALREAAGPGFTMLLFMNLCGTPACVLGHYAAREDLQRFLVIVGNYIKYATNRVSGYSPFNFRDAAFLNYMGLTYWESIDLFSGNGCNNAKTRKQAAQYIEDFLDKKGWEIE